MGGGAGRSDVHHHAYLNCARGFVALRRARLFAGALDLAQSWAKIRLTLPERRKSKGTGRDLPDPARTLNTEDRVSGGERDNGAPLPPGRNEGRFALPERARGRWFAAWLRRSATRRRLCAPLSSTIFAPRLTERPTLMRQGTDGGLAEEIVRTAMVTLWRKAAYVDPANPRYHLAPTASPCNGRIGTLSLRRDRSMPLLEPGTARSSRSSIRPTSRASPRTRLSARDSRTVRLAMEGGTLPMEKQSLARVVLPPFFDGLSHSGHFAETAPALPLPAR